MEIIQKYPVPVAAAVVVALALLGWSAWSVLAPPSKGDASVGKMGPITPMSSILGPNQSGGPRTTGTPSPGGAPGPSSMPGQPGMSGQPGMPPPPPAPATGQ